MKTESVVKGRYQEGAQRRVAELCCPVEYDSQYLEVIPKEVIERDYGCGDPSRYVRPGETVLDLGSGTGKICFIAAQVVGPEGKVIGVDLTDDMLEVARRNAPIVGERLGFHNVQFYKGRIQDLALDLEKWDAKLAETPLGNVNAYLEAEESLREMRRNAPMIADGSIDVVVSNCVLNLVSFDHRKQLFAEMHRVLRDGGRAVISDIVCNQTVPLEMQEDPELWSGCISGAFREDQFLEAFEQAGFRGVRILSLDEKPWQTHRGIEFRGMTLEATKVQPARGQGTHTVIYKGPFKRVWDDDGNIIERGMRMPVSEQVHECYGNAPYADSFITLPPYAHEIEGANGSLPSHEGCCGVAEDKCC